MPSRRRRERSSSGTCERVPVTTPELVRHARDRLSEAQITSADAEARWLVAEVTGTDDGGMELTAEPASERCLRRLDDMLERRIAGEPLQYVVEADEGFERMPGAGGVGHGIRFVHRRSRRSRAYVVGRVQNLGALPILALARGST